MHLRSRSGGACCGLARALRGASLWALPLHPPVTRLTLPWSRQLSVDFSDGGSSVYFLLFFLFSDCTFIADLILSFRTAVTREEHELVKRPNLIAKYYLKEWFFFDFIVSIPFDAIFGIAGVNDKWYLHLFKLLRMFRILKLMRILKKVRVSHSGGGARTKW